MENILKLLQEYETRHSCEIYLRLFPDGSGAVIKIDCSNDIEIGEEEQRIFWFKDLNEFEQKIID